MHLSRAHNSEHSGIMILQSCDDSICEWKPAAGTFSVLYLTHWISAGTCLGSRFFGEEQYCEVALPLLTCNLCFLSWAAAVPFTLCSQCHMASQLITFQQLPAAIMNSVSLKLSQGSKGLVLLGCVSSLDACSGGQVTLDLFSLCLCLLHITRVSAEIFLREMSWLLYLS
jgi:hypothetical protein